MLNHEFEYYTVRHNVNLQLLYELHAGLTISWRTCLQRVPTELVNEVIGYRQLDEQSRR